MYERGFKQSKRKKKCPRGGGDFREGLTATTS